MMNTPPPLTSSNSDDRLWIILCHISLILGVGLILPLIVYFVKKQDNPVVANHAKEALNFHISVYLYCIVSLILCIVLIGFLFLLVIGVGSLVLSIIACFKASEGGFYKYPLTLRLV